MPCGSWRKARSPTQLQLPPAASCATGGGDRCIIETLMQEHSDHLASAFCSFDDAFDDGTFDLDAVDPLTIDWAALTSAAHNASAAYACSTESLLPSILSVSAPHCAPFQAVRADAHGYGAYGHLPSREGGAFGGEACGDGMPGAATTSGTTLPARLLGSACGGQRGGDAGSVPAVAGTRAAAHSIVSDALLALTGGTPLAPYGRHQQHMPGSEKPGLEGSRLDNSAPAPSGAQSASAPCASAPQSHQMQARFIQAAADSEGSSGSAGLSVDMLVDSLVSTLPALAARAQQRPHCNVRSLLQETIRAASTPLPTLGSVLAHPDSAVPCSASSSALPTCEAPGGHGAGGCVAAVVADPLPRATSSLSVTSPGCTDAQARGPCGEAGMLTPSLA